MSHKKRSYVASKDIIYEVIHNELLLVHLKSGEVFYFTPGTKAIFDFFQKPQVLENFLKQSEAPLSDSEYLEDFCEQLVKMSIFLHKTAATQPGARRRSSAKKMKYSSPKFLRKHPKPVEEMLMAWAIS